jgi:drug/metabolite transporter (DMT)-like permease
VLAGVGFAGAYIAYSFTGAESGLWPLLGARVTSTVLLGLLALVTTRGLSLERPALVTAGWAGGLDIIANLSLITAIHLGPLAVASVLSSLYPVVTVLLARFVLHERMRGMQRVGVALAFLAVVLAALP